MLTFISVHVFAVLGGFCIDQSTVLKFQLNVNYSAAYGVAVGLLIVFQIGQNNFANNVFIQRFNIFIKLDF